MNLRSRYAADIIVSSTRSTWLGRPDHPRKLRKIYAAEGGINQSTAVVAKSYTWILKK
jgi:hypothetical protein